MPSAFGPDSAGAAIGFTRIAREAGSPAASAAATTIVPKEWPSTMVDSSSPSSRANAATQAA